VRGCVTMLAEAGLHGRRPARRRPRRPGGRHVICRAAPRPPLPGRARRARPSSREVKGTSRRAAAPVCAAPRHGAGSVRGH